MPMHEPYPVILERAIISRGILLEDRQDQLIGFAWSEEEVARMLSLVTSEAVGLVKNTPNSFSSDMSIDKQEKAKTAQRYWFVSRADEEIHIIFGQTTLTAKINQVKSKRNPRKLQIVA